ncbi:MAG: trypsin-like peptidase domain-containing protein [Hyphomicrobium sp.]|nr:trypsin-like peptidase domain-containing protein [Hyphomicrobium sp.]
MGGGDVAGLSITKIEEGIKEVGTNWPGIIEEVLRGPQKSGQTQPAPAELSNAISQTTAALRERTYQAVAQITATKPSASGSAGASKSEQSTASGFVIDASGLIVTTNALVDGAQEISVELHDGTRLPASVQGRDPRTDLALIKVEPKGPLSALRFGDSEKVKPGDWVAAMGSPFGLKGSITSGLVSATDRESPSGPYDVIQSDVRTSAGYGGGPLLNAEGEVIGVNSMIYAASGTPIGISFATPCQRGSIGR